MKTRLSTAPSAVWNASPLAIAASTSVQIRSMPQVVTAFRATFGPAQLWLEPTARNSNLLPVNASGEVRLRSVTSQGRGGMVETPTWMVPPRLERFAPPFCNWAMMSVSCSPR